MIHQMRAILATLAMVLGVATAAGAEIGPYLGASAGQTRVEIDPGDVRTAGFRIDDDDFAYKIYFGFELPGPLAVEGGFRDLGRVTDENDLVLTTSESDGIDAFVVGKLPLGPVSLFAKGGIIAWDTQVERRARGRLGLPDLRVSDDGTDFAWGLGIAFELGKWGVRGEFESFEIDLPDDLTMLSVGVTYSF